MSSTSDQSHNQDYLEVLDSMSEFNFNVPLINVETTYCGQDPEPPRENQLSTSNRLPSTSSTTSSTASSFASHGSVIYGSGSRQHRQSVYSTMSTTNTLYSAGNFSTDSEVKDLLSDKRTNDSSSKMDEEDLKRERFKQLFRSSKVKTTSHVHENPLDQEYFDNVTNRLEQNVFSQSTKLKLELDWDYIIETYLFGDLIENVFHLGNLESYQRNHELMDFLLNSHLESGEFRFTPIPTIGTHIPQEEILEAIKSILIQLDDFNDILTFYKAEFETHNDTKTFKSLETFNKLETFANKKGFTLPMAQSMFGTWLLSFAKGGDDSNYNDVRIMNQFRKAARMSLVLRKLNENQFFEECIKILNREEQISIRRFLKKDNEFALCMAIFSIAEYYQHVHGFDTAVNYWEANAHLTRDVESCNMAIWGLGDGLGGGNKVKKLDRLGSGSKRKKYNTKRRIAHLYRILIKNGGVPGYGTSWVFKEKYD